MILQFQRGLGRQYYMTTLHKPLNSQLHDVTGQNLKKNMFITNDVL